MDNKLTSQQQDAQIEDALKNYSLAPMPQKINANVMTQIKKNKRPTILTARDLWFGLIVIVCTAAIFFSLQFLPPVMLAKLRIQSILLYQDYLVVSRWLTPIILIGIAALTSATMALYFQRQNK